MYKKVLITTDTSEFSQMLARDALKHASLWGSEVIGLFVVDARTKFVGNLYHSHYEDYEARMKEEGREIVNCLKRLARLYGVKIKGRVRRGIPGKVIVALGKKEKADLIVLGAHSEATSPEKEYRGDTTRYVSRNAHCSVLIMRSGSEELSAS
jgi:nucleotide-binding universal stress UspA family protein